MSNTLPISPIQGANASDSSIALQQYEAKKKLEDKSQWDASTEIDWLHNNYQDYQETAKYTPKKDWKPTQEEIEPWLQGISEENQPIFGEAVSPEHALALRQRILERQKAEEIIYKDGFWEGTGYRLLASTLDPSAIAITAATEGLATPFVLANKATRLKNIAAHGLLSTASGLTVDGIMASLDPTMKPEDLLYSAAGNFVLGGAFGAFAKVDDGIPTLTDKVRVEPTLSIKTDTEQPSASFIEQAPTQLSKEDIEASFKSDLKAHLLGEASNKLDRGTTKNLVAEKKTLQQQIARLNLEKTQDVSSKGNHKASKERKEKVKLLNQEIEDLEGKLQHIQSQLDANRKPTEAEADLSRLEQGIIPDKYQNELNRRLTELSNSIQKEIELNNILETNTPLTERAKEDYADFLDTEGKPISNQERINKLFEDKDAPEVTFGKKYRIDRAATLAGSDNPETRKLSSMLMHDSAGKAVAGEDAHTWKSIYAGKHIKNTYESHDVNFKKYLEEKNQSSIGASYRHQERANFNFEVSRALQGDTSVSSAAKAHAATLRKAYQEVAERIVDPKKGETTGNAKALSDNYLEDYKQPRIWVADKLLEYRRLHGEDALHTTIAKAIKGVDDEAVRLRIAKHISRSVISTKDANGLDIERILSTSDIEDLKDLLRERTALNEDEIQEVAKTLSAKVDEKTDDAGKTSRLKHRIDLDELSEGISDLIDMDSERLFLNYINSMSGHVALSRHGISSKKDFDASLNVIRNSYEEKLSKASPKERAKIEGQRDKELNILEAAYKDLVGIPLADASGKFDQSMRILGKYNFIRLMNQMGFAQMSEIGVVLSQNSFRSTLKHVPELTKILRRVKEDGKFADKLLDELSDAMGGWGSERIMNQVSNRIDEQGSLASYRGGFLDKTETALDHAARFTSDISGFSVVDHLLKNLQMKGMVEDFLSIAKKGDEGISKAFTDSIWKKKQQRMAAIGLTKENFKPIAEQLTKYATLKPNGKIAQLNFEKWDNLDALNTFKIAMRLEGERTVLTPSFADLPVWGTGTVGGIEGSLGKALWQFKRFIAIAHTKLLVNGFKYRDAQTIATFLASSVTAGLAITAQTIVNSQGREDKESYIAQRLNPEELGKAIFQRSAWAGFLPMAIDAPSYFTGEALFKYRSSGLGADPITGTPLYNLFTQAQSASQGAFKSATDSSQNYSQQDFRALRSLLPFQNALLINNGLNVIQGELPKFSEY